MLRYFQGWCLHAMSSHLNVAYGRGQLPPDHFLIGQCNFGMFVCGVPQAAS